jgi:hypothetical protein
MKESVGYIEKKVKRIDDNHTIMNMGVRIDMNNVGMKLRSAEMKGWITGEGRSNLKEEKKGWAWRPTKADVPIRS